MAYIFELPDIGEGLTEAEIVKWLVAVGEHVGLDEPLVVIETDKTEMEIPSPVAGILTRQGGSEGDVLAMGTVLAELDTGEQTTTAPLKSGAEAAPIVGSLSTEADVLPPVHTNPQVAESTRPRAYPPIRRLAAENGIDLASVTGTGPNGRITRSDIVATIDSASQPAAEARVERMSATRRAIARNLSEAWAQIPQVTTFEWADAEALIETRRRWQHDWGFAVPMEAILMKAACAPIASHPEFNSRIVDNDLHYLTQLNIGLAVDTPAGLLVVVIGDVNSKSVQQLAQEFSMLVDKAKARQLNPADLSGQGFTISNIGAANGGFGTPLVPLNTAAIVGVGRAREEAVVRDGAVVPGLRMPLSLSYDHRIIDGAQGRSFISALIENLENPDQLVG